VDIARKVRSVERALGLEIAIHEGIPFPRGVPFMLTCNDWELDGRRFSTDLGPPSKFDRQIRAFHELIYHERAKAKHREQKGLCAHCQRPLRNLGECDHIKSRARGQRDDSLSNLRIVCSAMSGGCDFHRQRHQGGKIG
jgi:hypothetical protein